MANKYRNMELVGNIGSEPSLNTTPSGKIVLNFSLAVKKSPTNPELVTEPTTWVQVSVWGQKALASYGRIAKGDFVLVDANARLDQTTGEWERTRETESGAVFTDRPVFGNNVRMLRPAGAESVKASFDAGNYAEFVEARRPGIVMADIDGIAAADEDIPF